ncbi:hypothetical protein ACNKHU_15750 [Shigella flexneri]
MNTLPAWIASDGAEERSCGQASGYPVALKNCVRRICPHKWETQGVMLYLRTADHDRQRRTLFSIA